MKADLRISIKDHRRGKNLKVVLASAAYESLQYFVRMNGEAIQE